MSGQLEGNFALITDVRHELLDDLAGELKKADVSGVAKHLDVSSETEWASVVSEAERAFGRLNVVVNNAGS